VTTTVVTSPSNWPTRRSWRCSRCSPWWSRSSASCLPPRPPPLQDAECRPSLCLFVLALTHV